MFSESNFFKWLFFALYVGILLYYNLSYSFHYFVVSLFAYELFSVINEEKLETPAESTLKPVETVENSQSTSEVLNTTVPDAGSSTTKTDASAAEESKTQAKEKKDCVLM